MQVFASLESIPVNQFARGSVVAIGKFDGVHLAHQLLLKRSVDLAATAELESVVVTFANNPLSFLRPDLCPDPIMSREQRIDALAATGADACVMLPFDAALAAVTAERFVTEILVGLLAVQHLVVGSDFRFGSRGMGNVELLRTLGAEHGFSVEVLEDVADADLGKVSSSRVREEIVAGNVRAAARMLGRPAELRGTVVHGDARGRDLGFPTANLGGEIQGLIPGDGVYAGWAELRGERYPAAISVGANVTFDPEGDARVEAFLLDFSGDVYGAEMQLSFVERIRGMEKFDGVNALIAQMNRDVQLTAEILAAA